MKLINIKTRKKFCTHINIDLDLDIRYIECRDCGANIDAFDWIYKIAVEEDILMSRIRTLETQITALQNKKNSLSHKPNT